MRLPPYDPLAACPKCGHRTVDTRYESGQEWHSRHSPSHDIRGEHLVRRCCRCCYAWAEAPIIAPPLPTPATPGEF